jgi:N-acetylmuramoyl-L-alanine amidase
MREGRRPLPTLAVGGQEMVALSDLAAAFQLTVHEDALAGGLTVTYRGRSIVMTPGQGLASVGGRLVSLPAPATRDGRGGWLVPIDFISRALALVYEGRLDVRRPSRLVVVGDLRVPRVIVRTDAAGAQTRVTIEATPRTGYIISEEPTRIVVRFEADAVDAAIPPIEPGPLVQAVQVLEGQPALAVLRGARTGPYRASDASSDPTTTRIALSLGAEPGTETAGPGGAPPAPGMATGPTPAPGGAPGPLPTFEAGPAPALRTIVIDPGHGGDEAGARGPGGTEEKTVTLAVARRLKALVENRLGLRVLLTRDRDATVRLDERAAVANNNKADLFLSLHANASPQAAVSGAEVFSLSIEEYGEEAELAASEPQALPVFGGGMRPIDVILWDMAQVQHMGRSGALAAIVEAELRRRVPMSVRPLQQAPLRVLVGANMPAVLVEMGFLSNPQQERQLASDTFQVSVAQALLDSIVRFRQRLEQERAGGAPAEPPAAAPAAAIGSRP